MKKRKLILNLFSGSAKVKVGGGRPTAAPRRSAIDFDANVTLANDSAAELVALGITVVAFSKDSGGVLQIRTYHPQLRKGRKGSTLHMRRVVGGAMSVTASRGGKGGAKHCIFAASLS
ncbi:MAG: hypothetical protein ABMA26_04905 [Limisphaerales bacterium]